MARRCFPFTTRAQIKELEETGDLTLRYHFEHPVPVIQLLLTRAVDLSNSPFRSFGDSINNIATYFNIAPTEAYDLDQAADLLVREKYESILTGFAKDLGTPATRPSATQQ